MTEKNDWVIVSITPNTALAKEIKSFLDIVLNWQVLEWKKLLESRPLLKAHVKNVSFEGSLVFGLARKSDRNMGEKAGFVIE